MSPLISVVMPVYNGERFLREAVESILSQTCRDFEFIIIDDGSTDATQRILTHYQKLDRRIVVKRQSENQGLVSALNLGCSLATGEFIARMDADDICLPQRFEMQIQAFGQISALALVGSAALIIDEKGSTLSSLVMPIESGHIKWCLIFCNCIVHSSVMMRREVAVGYGFYTPNFEYAEDYELWSRISTSETMLNLAQPLIKYRVWGSGISFAKKNQQRMLVENISHNLLTHYLEKDISEQIASVFPFLQDTSWGLSPTNIGQIRQTSKILDELYVAYCNKVILSDIEKKTISRDVAEKFYELRSIAMEYSTADAAYIAINGLRHDSISLKEKSRIFWKTVVRNAYRAKL